MSLRSGAEGRKQAAAYNCRDTCNQVQHRAIGVAAGKGIRELFDRRTRCAVSNDEKHRTNNRERDAQNF